MAGTLYEYVANLHVHTDFSDGSGSMAEVIEAANKAGLDLLLINDHDTLAGRDQGWEGRHGRVLVLVGVELSGRHNHILAYGLESMPAHDWKNPQASIDGLNQAGGIGFLAHPFERGSPMSEGGRAFTWEDWSVTGFTGLCVWNYTSSWKARAQGWLSGFYHFFFRAGTLPGPDPEVLEKWDELGLARRTSGIAGSDAHAYRQKVVGKPAFCIFPYQYLFRAVNTHVLLSEPLSGNLEQDSRAVYQALAEGSCFLAHDRLHRSEGFDFRLERGGERSVGQGGEAKYEPGDQLAWGSPRKAPTRLLRNGRTLFQKTVRDGKVAVPGPGVYRIEVFCPTLFFGPRPWIFSNPIYLR